MFFLMIRRPPRSTRTDTLFPYTTLFRSDIDDNNERAVRAKLQFQLSDRFQIKLTADYSRADDAQAPHFAGTAPNNAPPLGVTLLGGTVPTRLRDISSEADPVRRNRFWGLSAHTSYEFRSEERRVGKECVSTFNSRGSPYH